ncbi:MAG: translocation/assembly module TamB, partial [Deltaproteobacteria bacterium]|nr:translocation/assembly module TamB [Deltaproteobacteria bacterium]
FSASVRGKLTDPTGTAKVVLRDGRLSGNTPADAELVLAASRRKVRLESLKGKLWGGILSGSAEYDLAAAAGEAKLSLRQAALGAAPWAAFGVPARPVGTGDAEVRMSGGPARLRGTILLSIPEGFGIPPGADGRPVRARLPLSVAASGEIVPGREIVLSNFRIRLGGARVEGNGSASLPGREIAFRGTATAPAGKVSDYGWEYPLAWQGLSGQWEIAGPADRPRLSARIEGEGLAARALPPLSAVVRIEGNAADVVHFAADIPSSLGRATATGTVTGPFNHGPFHLEATAVVREIDFSQGARWGRAVLSSLGRDPSGVPRIMDEVTGSGTADLRIVVGTGSIILGGSVRIPEVRVRGMPLRAVRAEGNWESGPGREEWHAEASGEAAGGTLEVTGKGRESGMEIAGSLERLDVGQAAALLGAKTGGSVRGAATVSFVARRRGEVWELPRVAATSPEISAGGMTWQGVSVEGFLGPASGKMSLRTASPAVRAEADIRREPGWPVTATLSARGVPNAVFLAAAGRRGEAAGGSWNLAAEGSARAADLARPGADPADAIGSFRFSAVADNLSVSGMTFRSLVASGRKEESRIRGEIRTSAPESDLAFSLALREPFAFRLEGPFAMATAAGESGSENGTPRFAVSGRVDVGGALRAIDQASGTLHVARLRFRQYGVEITGRDLDAALDAGGVRWVGGTVEAAGNPLRVSGKVSWKGDMDVRVAGKVPAAAIRMATDVFDRLDGTIRAEARFTGPLGNPTVVGTGHLEAGAFSFKGYAQLFEEMTADAVISKEKILFEHFEGRSGGGYVEGWGEVPLAFGAGQRFYFSVDFFDVRYPYPDDFRPVIQGHMELIGPIDDLLVTGDLEVQSARYTRTIRPEKSLVDFRRRVAAVTARREQGEFRIRLDIDAVADGTIRIKNNLVDAQAKGEFKIVGDSSRVIVLGAFDVVEGTIEYRGNKYEIKRLTVDFQDPRRNNPRIDGRAETRKGNVVITVSVTGTLDQYEVEFASDPPLSKNSIVSLLSLGVPAEALAGAEGTVGAGAAASVALGPYKGRVEEEIRGIVGLDKFAVEPVFSPTSKSFESRFTIGKDFGDRFSVSFSTNVGGATPDSAATAEFKVGENVFLEGAWQSSGIQPEGAVGGDVKFRYRYKQFKDFLGRGAE